MQTPLQGNPGAGFVYQTPGQQAYNLPTRYYGSFSNAPQSITQAPNTPVPVVGQPVTPPIDTPESCAARGMVFNPETGMCVLPDPVQTPQPTGGDDRDKPDVPQVDPNAWMKDYNYTSDNTLFATSAEELNRPQTIMEKIFGGGILGALGKAGTAAQIAANVKILEAQGSIDLAKSLQSRLDKYKEDNNLDWLPDFLIGGSRLSASALEVLKLDPTSLVNAKAPYRIPTAEQIKISTGRDVTGGGLEEAKKIKEKTEKEGPTEKQKEAAARVESALKESKSVEEILAPDKKEKERRSEFHEKLHNDMVAKAARERAQEAADKLGVGLATGGRNKGGLMRKKKK